MIMVQTENGICKISEVKKTFPYGKVMLWRNEFLLIFIGNRKYLLLVSDRFFLNFTF